MSQTGGGGLAQTPLVVGWHIQEEKDELTSCRGTVQSAWQKTSSENQRRKSRAAQKGKVAATWYWDDSLHLSLPNSQPCFGGSKGCARVTGKAGENGQ